MNIQEWIAHVDALRARGGLLATGEWHGYLAAGGGDAPMRGQYVLARWASPTMIVSHDDPEEVVELAKSMERGYEVHRQFRARPF